MVIESSPTLLVALGIGLVVGALCAFLLGRRANAADRKRADRLKSEVERMRGEFDSYRGDVSRHFEKTSDLFQDLTGQYTKLYAHLASGARDFSTDEIPALGRLDTPLLGDEPVGAEEAESEESAAEGEAPIRG